MKFLLKLLLLLFFIYFQSCTKDIKKDIGYIINGKINGLSNGKAKLIKLDLTINESKDVDSTLIKNGKFTFSGKIKSPYLHTILLNKGKDKIHLFLENSKIDINGDINHLDQVKISGSREDSLFHSYTMDEIFDRKKGMEIMLNYPDYSFAAFTAYYQFQIFNIQSDTLDRIINNFKNPVKETLYFKHLNSLYKTLKRVAINQPAPVFSIPDIDGKPVKLESFKGKYVLIDFWASWCAPCRAVNPHLVEIYNKYANKNFTIIGISVDKNRESWKRAIEKDKLPWVNVSNVKGWDKITDSYAVKAIPQNFLLDDKGFIIAKNLEPKQIVEILDRVLDN